MRGIPLFTLRNVNLKLKKTLRNVNKYVQYPELRKGLQKEETKILELVIYYLEPVIDYKYLCTPTD